MDRTAKANVTPVRQRTQYSCMAASMAMALRALGHECDEDEVNKVMGARPMKGAAWEEALACAQHYGCRATLTTPATVTQLKAWTDAGTPVMIAWNPEGRDWSHASVVFDVVEGPEGRVVHVADPNMPNPEKTVREVPEDDFYGKWFEKWPNYLVRRPALAIEREITPQGRQVVASAPAKSREEMIEKYKHLSNDVRTFLGIPPEDTGSNIEWGDGYFFNQRIRSRYKVKNVDELIRKLKIDPKDLRGCCSKWRAASRVAGWDWKKFAQEVAKAIRSKYKISPRRITGEANSWGYEIYTEWGYDYDRKRGWNDDRLEGIIESVAAKHGLEETGWLTWATPDGKRITVSIQGSATPPGNVRLAGNREDFPQFYEELEMVAQFGDNRTVRKLKSRKVKDQIAEYAEALGTAGEKIPDWLLVLGRMEKVDTRKIRDHAEMVTVWLGELRDLAMVRLLEAKDTETLIQQAAWDAGYEGERPAKWLVELGKHFGIDVRKHNQNGLKEYKNRQKEDRYASDRKPSALKVAEAHDGWRAEAGTQWKVKLAITQEKRKELESESAREQYLNSDRYLRDQKQNMVNEKFKYITRIFHRAILPGWGSQQTDPEVLAFVTRMVARKRLVSPWQAETFLKKWKLQPHAEAIVLKLLREAQGMGKEGDRNFVPPVYGAAYKYEKNPNRWPEIPPPVVKKWAPHKDRFKPYTGPVPGSGSLTKAPKTVVDSTGGEKLNILRSLADKVKDWPEGLAHVEKVIAEYERGRTPSGDDLKKIRNFLYRNRMRSEADLFRMARKKQKEPKHRLGPEEYLKVRRRPGAGPHHTREQDVESGRSRKPKHKKDLRRDYAASASRVAARYLGED